MKYNQTNLIEQLHNGEKMEWLFFWGHTAPKDGSMSNAVFSQWRVTPFTVDGIEYATAEHWMMAGKARLFGDEEMLEQILAAKTPLEAKRLGRKVRNWDAEKWDAHKFQIVLEGNKHKFSQHPRLKEWLLNTGEKVIVEAAPRDRIWGIGMGRENPNARNPEKWRGQNLLGFVLMEVRDWLKENL